MTICIDNDTKKNKRSEVLKAMNYSKMSTLGIESMLEDITKKRILSSPDKNEMNTYNVSISDTSMYDVSKRMKQLQRIYDHRLITVCYDDILLSYKLGKGNPPAVKQEKMTPKKHKNL